MVFSPNGACLTQIQRSVRELILWDWQLVRQQLAEMKLDWESPTGESAPKWPKTPSAFRSWAVEAKKKSP